MQVILQADQRPKQNHKDAILPAHPLELYLLGKEFGLMLNHKNIRSPIIQCRRNWSIFFVMEVYFETMMEQIEFWRIKGCLQDHLVFYQTNDDEKWKSSIAGGGGHKKIFQYCTDSSGTVVYFRALQGHSGRNLIDLSLQDSVVILDDFVKYIYHVGCAINLHSIGLIPGCQNLSHRYFFCLWIPWTKIIRILTRSTWKQCVLHSTCMKHGRNIETLCVGSTSHLLKRKDWNSIRHDRTLSFFTKNTPSLLCSESCSDGNWTSHIRESTCVTSILF